MANVLLRVYQTNKVNYKAIKCLFNFLKMMKVL